MKASDTIVVVLMAACYAIVLAVVTVVAMVPFFLFKAWAVSILWRWFAVPLGAFQLNIAVIMGFLVIIELLRRNTYVKDERPKTEQVVAALVEGIIGPAMALGFGWLIKYFGGI